MIEQVENVEVVKIDDISCLHHLHQVLLPKHVLKQPREHFVNNLSQTTTPEQCLSLKLHQSSHSSYFFETTLSKLSSLSASLLFLVFSLYG